MANVAATLLGLFEQLAAVTGLPIAALHGFCLASVIFLIAYIALSGEKKKELGTTMKYENGQEVRRSSR